MRKYSDEEILNAYEKAGTKAGAARMLKMDERGYKRRLKRIVNRDSTISDIKIPAGYSIKGTSTLYDADGVAKAQWVKTQADKEQQEEAFRIAVEALKESLPRERPVNAPKDTHDDLASLYVITDYHMGAYSWQEETGADWDTDIAENLLVDWFATAIRSAPDSSVGILANIGDYLHWDGLEAVTPTNHNVLDADTRFQRVIRVAIRVIRRIIRMLLAKHDQVHVLMAEGNHDLASSAWLRELFAAIYEDESRVTVDTSPDIYYCYEHGNTSLFFHHGHRKKVQNVDSVFAGKFRDVFGRTKYSYAHMGHLHHNHKIETNLMEVEQHRTLASPDSHASRGGWLSGRDAKVITYSKRFGEVGRITINPEMCSGSAIQP